MGNISSVLSRWKSGDFMDSQTREVRWLIYVWEWSSPGPDPARGHTNWPWPLTFQPVEVNDSGPVTRAVTSESGLSGMHRLNMQIHKHTHLHPTTHIFQCKGWGQTMKSRVSVIQRGNPHLRLVLRWMTLRPNLPGDLTLCTTHLNLLK